MITKQDVAKKIIAYLRHKITLEELVDWSERILIEAEYDENDFETINDIVSKLGLADVRAFGLLWEDCESYLKRLGYSPKIDFISVA
jgi:hypothetical protein